jgi:hypothetical protein
LTDSNLSAIDCGRVARNGPEVKPEAKLDNAKVSVHGCSCGKEFWQTDHDGIVFCAKCKRTIGLAAKTAAKAKTATK